MIKHTESPRDENPTVATQIRIPVEMDAQLKALARQERRSKTGQILVMLRDALRAERQNAA